MLPEEDSTRTQSQPDVAPAATPASHPRRRHTAGRICRIAGLSFVGALMLIVVVAAGATWWLNPERLTRIFNERASAYLTADVHAHRVNFTLWSTFPHFRLRIDSLQVVSRALAGITPAQRDSLPANADSLLSLSSLEGGINVMQLIRGRISLGDMKIDGLSVNAVALSDSLANYNILPADAPSAVHVPRITARSLQLSNPGPITYYSAVTATSIHAALTDASMRRVEAKKADTYALQVDGHFSASVGALRVFHHFPFGLNGNVQLGFSPLKLRMESYKVRLADITTELSADMTFGDSVTVSSMHSEVRPFRVRNLIACLPEAYRPDISNLSTDLTAHASVRLTAPFVFSADKLPSFDLNFAVPHGTVDYRTTAGRTITFRETGLLAQLHFDGTNPGASVFELMPMQIAADGVECSLSARASNLLGNVLVSANMDGTVRLHRLADFFPALRGMMSVDGNAEASASASMRLGSLSAPNLTDVEATASITVPSASLQSMSQGLTTSLDSLTITATLDRNLTGIDVASSLRGASLKTAGQRTDIKALRASAHFPMQWRSLPASMRISAQSLIVAAGRTLRAEISRPEASASAILADMANLEDLRKALANVGAKRIRIDDGVHTATINGAHISFTSAPRAATAPLDAYRLPPDTVSSGPHTPEWLAITLPPAGRRAIARRALALSIQADSASYFTPSYPMPLRASAFHLGATTDSISLSPLTLRCGVSALTLAGHASNLERLMLLGGTEPLRLRFSLDADTVNLNQLAHLYETGAANVLVARSSTGLTKAEARQMVLNPSTSNTLSASDTTTLLLPRNIEAQLRVKAKAADYTNLHFFDIGTTVNMADGHLAVDSLFLSSYFGKAFMSFDLRTTNPQAYSASAYLNIVEIDLEKFYARFNKLVEMWPQMTNLSGFISAGATLGVSVFPNMTINIPSIWARIDAEGYRLKLHQDPFIRHITKMMLIGTSGDIHIPTIRLRANVHSNLVEVDPFTIVFDRYEVRTTGMNDFDGNLYYHIGVEKSPIPFKYAINVVGNYDHPKIRFGGFDYKSNQAMQLNSIVKHTRINLVKEAKYYLRTFVRHASEADTIPSAAN